MSEHSMRTLTEADAEAIAKKVTENLFETLGFDVSTREGRLEAQGAFRWLLICYRAVGIVGRVGVGGGVSILVIFLIYKITGWSGPPSR